MKEKLFLLCIFLTSVSAYADIATNPIKAKSISTPIPTSVRMVKEKVIVDLHKDSSVVKCTFYMKILVMMKRKYFFKTHIAFTQTAFLIAQL